VSGAIALNPDDSGVMPAPISGPLSGPISGPITGPILAAAAAAIRRESPTARDEEEQILINRCVAGDAEAFRPLVQRYQRVAFSVALRMLGTRADAEDVAQQAFVDAFNALDRFHGDGREHAFSTWLLRIVVNRSKDVLKSKKRTEEPLDREVRGEDAAFAYDPSNPEANVAGGERRQRLEAALLSVPPKYREVLILKDIEELSYEEIRGILQLPVTTLKIRVVRARAMLRERIDRDG
jgi:RNA polymerase sigma-70 factor (ECF subfamily)